ncbi:phosphate signaling complex protein PhoU [Methanoplanus sp. FWC-SCC4]|uniref:Phosphate-specific transport system accessory protein PhoU n=1 Tax=Methanochimaera problematica TaxID=2609417 RepID=A0AA97FDL2_9EURY|nr:phosphate signaling complex protein PhoU [Methanoplanus sp. FWC-SCC4]WOF16103.1 phosphate signaling complex protein PhoU [Methanoplanus sp. FWC-SCC4]
MHDKFHEELDSLKKEVIEMGNFSIEMLSDSLKALKSMDKELAEDVYLRKEKLSDYYTQIEEETLRILALYQPVAADIRTITCISQMNVSFYRVGRNGKKVAKLVKSLEFSKHLEIINSLCRMGKCVISMLNDALDGFKSEKTDKLQNLSYLDDDVDNLQKSIFRESISYMMEDKKNISGCIEYVMVSSHLERVGDHACLMAEKIYFMVEGKRIEIK